MTVIRTSPRTSPPQGAASRPSRAVVSVTIRTVQIVTDAPGTVHMTETRLRPSTDIGTDPATETGRRVTRRTGDEREIPSPALKVERDMTGMYLGSFSLLNNSGVGQYLYTLRNLGPL